jgi:hypothetical protein
MLNRTRGQVAYPPQRPSLIPPMNVCLTPTNYRRHSLAHRDGPVEVQTGSTYAPLDPRIERGGAAGIRTPDLCRAKAGVRFWTYLSSDRRCPLPRSPVAREPRVARRQRVFPLAYVRRGPCFCAGKTRHRAAGRPSVVTGGMSTCLSAWQIGCDRSGYALWPQRFVLEGLGGVGAQHRDGRVRLGLPAPVLAILRWRGRWLTYIGGGRGVATCALPDGTGSDPFGPP